jgi:hypothetical protein
MLKVRCEIAARAVRDAALVTERRSLPGSVSAGNSAVR